MNDFRKQENIDELRKRLYSRSVPQQSSEKHELTDITPKADVSTEWNKTGLSETKATAGPETSDPEAGQTEVSTEFKKQKPKRHYRLFIIVSSLLIFLFGVGFSIVYLLFGGNQISSDNIDLTLAGPSSVGGGEAMALQLSVSNQNNIPIESATVIVNYPQGSRSANETGRELFEERIPINSVAAGEVQNVPIRFTVFGEEGQEKQIRATIEYRIEGSNGTFYKDSQPFSFRITSTPLVLRVSNIEKVAAGQEVEMKLMAQSNASNPLTNLLVQAEYPNGFDFQESFPAPVFGENVWSIEELQPDDTEEITIRGIVRGITEETFRVNFDVGPVAEGNPYQMGSLLTEAWADFTIERPFIDVAVTINDDGSNEVIIPAGEDSKVSIDITNTLDETVYDLVVEVVPGGNALREDSVQSQTGFYDSNNGTVRWEVANNPEFSQIVPGGTKNLSFLIDPIDDLGTASFDLQVNVYARRIAQTSVQEQLIGTNLAVAKFSSKAFIGGQVDTNSGPIPPKVGETTTYTISLVAEAGVNDLADTVVNTSLPLYVTWLDDYEGEGIVTYNTVSKQLEWKPGGIEAKKRKQLTFDVSIRPSLSQLDSTPTLVNSQQLTTTDKYTNAKLRASAPALTIALSEEAGFTDEDGVVVPAN